MMIWIFFVIFLFPVDSTNNSFNVRLTVDEQQERIELFFNVTTNSLFYLTFRSFGKGNLKYGLYSPTSTGFQESSLSLIYSLSKTDQSHLFIICFYFLIATDDVEIQCEDHRLSRTKTTSDFLPTYHPYFVPLMYALCILMILPVTIQHHREKKALIFRRRKELRRLSMNIAPENGENYLRKMGKNTNLTVDYRLNDAGSERSLETICDTTMPIAFTLENFHRLLSNFEEILDDQQSMITADDSVAHLLDKTPWREFGHDSPLVFDPIHEKRFQRKLTTFVHSSEENSNKKFQRNFAESNV